MKTFALIFDMDGVIVDNHAYHLKAWLSFFDQHQIAMSEEEYKQKVNGRTMQEIIATLFDKDHSPEQIRRLGEEKEALYRDMYQRAIQPTPGLRQFLDVLDQNNIPRAVATSAPPANVQFTMKKTGLAAYFPVIVDDTMVSRGKPDPEVYLTAAQQLDMPPAGCIVFEDAMLGIQAGKNAGMKVVGLATTHAREELERTEVDLVIDHFEQLSLAQLKALIDQ